MTSGGVYYNEIDMECAQWLKVLMERKVIADGDVDTRSISEVSGDDLRGYDQCHFFAGIGTWSYALRQAGWPDTRSVWTGSCPCQPFSQAGKGEGGEDERHMWPEFSRLISECRPDAIYSEQVASKGGLAWLDNVQADLEDEGYAVGSVDTSAAGFGAPINRQRLYISSFLMGRAECEGLERHTRTEREAERWALTNRSNAKASVPNRDSVRGATNGFWADADWDKYEGNKWRPCKPSSSVLVDGPPARVLSLRGFGNGIVAPQAAAVIEAGMDALKAIGRW